MCVLSNSYQGLHYVLPQGHHSHHDSDGDIAEDVPLPPIGNSLGKSNAVRRGTLPPPPSYYDGPAYSMKGSKPSNAPAKRQSGAVKYVNKVAQGMANGVQAMLTAQTSIKYNKMGAVSSGTKQGAGGSKYLSPYSLRNLAGQEQVTF